MQDATMVFVVNTVYINGNEAMNFVVGDVIAAKRRAAQLNDRPGVVGVSEPRPATLDEVRINRHKIPARFVPAAIAYCQSLTK